MQTLYAFPAVMQEGAELMRKLNYRPIDLSSVYTESKKFAKTMINYSNFDIAKKKSRQVTIAYPIFIKG